MNGKRPTLILSTSSCPICSGTHRVIFEDQGPHVALLPKLISGELEVPEIKKPRDGAA
jgi:hypothetical protein